MWYSSMVKYGRRACSYRETWHDASGCAREHTNGVKCPNADSFAVHTNLIAGDILDFTVYGGYDYANTPLRVRITTDLTQQVRTRCVGTSVATVFNLIRGGTPHVERAEVLNVLNQWTECWRRRCCWGRRVW